MKKILLLLSVLVIFSCSKDESLVDSKQEDSLDFDILGKWYIQNPYVNKNSSVNKEINKQSEDGNCSIISIEFRENGTYTMVSDEDEVEGKFVITSNNSLDLGGGEIEDLSFINDVLGFRITLDLGCSSDYSAMLLTHVPDDVFENELIKLGYDDVHDNFVLTKNLESVIELKLHPYEMIFDMTGLEAFESLEVLEIYNGSSNTRSDYLLDLSQNNALRELSLDTFVIQELNVSNNPKLEEINIIIADIKDIDLTNNSVLKEIYISQNGMIPDPAIDIDFSNNPILERIIFDDVSLGKINITKNKNLQIVSINESIDELITSGTYEDLWFLGITGSGHYYYDLDFSGFPNIQELQFNTNSQQLDLSNNLKLVSLDLQATNLVSLDLSYNSSLSYFEIYAPELMCIKVNGEQLSKLETEEQNWSRSYNYSLDCQ